MWVPKLFVVGPGEEMAVADISGHQEFDKLQEAGRLREVTKERGEGQLHLHPPLEVPLLSQHHGASLPLHLLRPPHPGVAQGVLNFRLKASLDWPLHLDEDAALLEVEVGEVELDDQHGVVEGCSAVDQEKVVLSLRS